MLERRVSINNLLFFKIKGEINQWLMQIQTNRIESAALLPGMQSSFGEEVDAIISSEKEAWLRRLDWGGLMIRMEFCEEVAVEIK